MVVIASAQPMDIGESEATGKGTREGAKAATFSVLMLRVTTADARET